MLLKFLSLINLFRNCPNQHCLRCGQPGVPFSENCNKCRYLDSMDCRLCGGRGHIQSRCPDTWRRYHATLSPNTGKILLLSWVLATGDMIEYFFFFFALKAFFSKNQRVFDCKNHITPGS